MFKYLRNSTAVSHVVRTKHLFFVFGIDGHVLGACIQSDVGSHLMQGGSRQYCAAHGDTGNEKTC